MIGLIVNLVVVPDSGDAFERAFAVQAAAVRANEPGNRLYELFRSQAAPNSYTLIEIYEDERSLNAHRESTHMEMNRPLITPLLDGPPARQAFELVSMFS